jgi:hypothetical protein
MCVLSAFPLRFQEEQWNKKFHEVGEPETLATIQRLQMQAEQNSKPVEEMLLKSVYTVGV